MQQICLPFGLCGKSGSVSHALDCPSFEDSKGRKISCKCCTLIRSYLILMLFFDMIKIKFSDWHLVFGLCL